MQYNISKIEGILSEIRPFFLYQYSNIVESTNDVLLHGAREDSIKMHGAICLAEKQTASKGRNGKKWIDGEEHSLSFSLAYKLGSAPFPYGLSLVVGVAVASALENLGIDDIALKWPNDIVLASGKMGGILIEIEKNIAVIGVGLNISNSPILSGSKANTATCLSQHGYYLNRDDILCSILMQCANCLDVFFRSGFGVFKESWQQRDYLFGKKIKVCHRSGSFYAIACGLSDIGALLVSLESGEEVEFISGDISVVV